MTSWSNIIAHNYICLFESDLSFSIKGLRRTIDIYKTQTNYGYEALNWGPYGGSLTYTL